MLTLSGFAIFFLKKGQSNVIKVDLLKLRYITISLKAFDCKKTLIGVSSCDNELNSTDCSRSCLFSSNYSFNSSVFLRFKKGRHKSLEYINAFLNLNFMTSRQLSQKGLSPYVLCCLVPTWEESSCSQHSSSAGREKLEGLNSAYPLSRTTNGYSCVLCARCIWRTGKGKHGHTALICYRVPLLVKVMCMEASCDPPPNGIKVHDYYDTQNGREHKQLEEGGIPLLSKVM